MEQKKTGEKFDEEKKSQGLAIHARGSLGLLALGAVGIKAWRKVRAEEEEKKEKKGSRKEK